MDVETNIFPIANLADLSSRYQLYRVRGLKPEHPDDFRNCETLVRRLSYTLRSPIAAIDIAGEPHLAVQDGAPALPSPYLLVRTPVYLDPIGTLLELDYTLRTPENDAVCLRFINFMLQAPLHVRHTLWQFGSGKPFFNKVQRSSDSYRATRASALALLSHRPAASAFASTNQQFCRA